MEPIKQHKATSAPKSIGVHRSYNDIVQYLDEHWTVGRTEESFQRAQTLHAALGNPAAHVRAILIGGTNGKSLTCHFTAKLLAEEGFTSGILYSPHLISYTERFSAKNKQISQKTFTEIANLVINTAEAINLGANTQELLIVMAACFFKQEEVTIAVIEVADDLVLTPFKIFKATILGITRMTKYTDKGPLVATEEVMTKLLATINNNTFVVSADQSKINLQYMQETVEKIGGRWAMPIRKLTVLPYPFEQLHGRCAALAERICYLYLNDIIGVDQNGPLTGLLAKRKGMRGRPPLEVKRQLELNPKRTIEQFWKETVSDLPGRFQLLDKEKPTVLLDNAANIDAFKNLLLGIRLLHYNKPLKGLAVILACNEEDADLPELLKALRYFFKKTSGTLIICPTTAIPGQIGRTSWNTTKVVNDLKSMKIKALVGKNFAAAFESATNVVDERQGLIVVAGSTSAISQYWEYKGIKQI